MSLYSHYFQRQNTFITHLYSYKMVVLANTCVSCDKFLFLSVVWSLKQVKTCKIVIFGKNNIFQRKKKFEVWLKQAIYERTCLIILKTKKETYTGWPTLINRSKYPLKYAISKKMVLTEIVKYSWPWPSDQYSRLFEGQDHFLK